MEALDAARCFQHAALPALFSIFWLSWPCARGRKLLMVPLQENQVLLLMGNGSSGKSCAVEHLLRISSEACYPPGSACASFMSLYEALKPLAGFFDQTAGDSDLQSNHVQGSMSPRRAEAEMQLASFEPGRTSRRRSRCCWLCTGWESWWSCTAT